jgi:carboxymethylenebutenolidase
MEVPMTRALGIPRLSLLVLLSCLTALGALAQGAGMPPDEAGARVRLDDSPRHGEWVSFDSGGADRVAAWVVYPERPDPAPVVLVVHEIFGLTDWVRAVADQLAAEGFIAIAPDLLSGKGPGGKGSSSVDADGARALIAALDPEEVTRRLDATSAYALALPAAAKKFGVLGFCWGGGISFGYAAKRQDLGASVAFYGVAPPAQELARIKAPVLALYGGSDARVTSTEAPAAAELKRLGSRFEFEIYPGAGHAFLRQQSGMNGANMEAAKKAWPRALGFLKETLTADRTGALDTGRRAVAEAPAVLDDCCCCSP